MLNLRNYCRATCPQPANKFWLILWSILSLFGLLDAGYLSLEHWFNRAVICRPGFQCQEVLNSSYAYWFTWPVAYLGLLYYLSVFIFLSIFIAWRRQWSWHLLLTTVSFGLLVSVYFTYVQFFIIKALCPYCLLSAVTTAILFFSLMVYWYQSLDQRKSLG